VLTYSYDAQRRLTSIAYAGGSTYNYDTQGRVTSIQYSNGNVLERTYAGRRLVHGAGPQQRRDAALHLHV